MKNTLLKEMEKKYKIILNYKTDEQWFTYLKKDGVPSLARLLKMVR